MIAVATLLVAVVGATFAYFTATTGSSATGNDKVEASTANVGNRTLTYTGTTGEAKMQYPGGMMVIPGSVEAKVETTNGTPTPVDFSFKLGYDIGITNIEELDANTTITWKIYETTSQVTPLIPEACKEKIETGQGDSENETHYAYTGCEVTAFGSNSVAEGTLSSSSLTATGNSNEITFEGVTGTTTKYYYLVLTYPDNNKQNGDMGAKISAQITGISDDTYTVKPVED